MPTLKRAAVVKLVKTRKEINFCLVRVGNVPGIESKSGTALDFFISLNSFTYSFILECLKCLYQSERFLQKTKK